MYQYERSYKTGRGVFTFLEFIGWCVVVIGAILALVGFGTGGILGSVSRYAGEGTPFLSRILSMIPGLFMVIGGLFSIAFAQVGRANLDSAEMQREMLALARQTSGSTTKTRNVSKPVAPVIPPAATAPTAPTASTRGTGGGFGNDGTVIESFDENSALKIDHFIGRRIFHRIGGSAVILDEGIYKEFPSNHSARAFVRALPEN